jgi:hypothetical protein
LLARSEIPDVSRLRTTPLGHDLGYVLSFLVIALVQLCNHILVILLISILAQLEAGLNFDRYLKAYNSFHLRTVPSLEMRETSAGTFVDVDHGEESKLPMYRNRFPSSLLACSREQRVCDPQFTDAFGDLHTMNLPGAPKLPPNPLADAAWRRRMSGLK